MRRTIALTILIGVLAVGCGSADASSGLPPSGRPTDRVPGGPSKNRPSAHPYRVTPRRGMSGLRKIPWFQARRRGHGRRVILTYGSGVPPCSVLGHVDVVYHDKTIVVTLWEGYDPNGGNVCSALGRLYSVAVRLRGGTNDWTLQDGAKN